MANNPFSGNKIIMQLDMNTAGGTPDWSLVGCLTDTDIDGSRDTIDASSKCGPAQLPGQATNTSNFTVFMNATPDVDEVTLDELAAVYDAADLRHWRLLDDEGGSAYYREFYGYLTNWNEASNLNSPVTGTATIAISGNIIRTLPVS